MSKQIDALTLALEGGGLYEITGRIEDIDKCIVHRSVIKEALAQPEQRSANEHLEPVAWKLVPVKSTREIEDAIGNFRNLKASEIWEDALAAISTPPQPKEPEQEQSGFFSREAMKAHSDFHVAQPEQDEYLSKAYRLANELRCHLAIAPAPQRTWVGLTDEETAELVHRYAFYELARQIEAKLKERNQ